MLVGQECLDLAVIRETRNADWLRRVAVVDDLDCDGAVSVPKRSGVKDYDTISGNGSINADRVLADELGTPVGHSIETLGNFELRGPIHNKEQLIVLRKFSQILSLLVVEVKVDSRWRWQHPTST